MEDNIYKALDKVLETYPAKQIFDAMETAIRARLEACERLNLPEMVNFWRLQLKSAEAMNRRAERLLR